MSSSSYTPSVNPVPTPADVDQQQQHPFDAEGVPQAKRRRINFACNYCRNRKTRCDEQKPSCRACIAAGIECVTTDRRRPGVEVQRRETKRRTSRASVSSSSTGAVGVVGPPYASPQSVEGPRSSLDHGRAGSNSSPDLSRSLLHDDREPTATNQTTTATSTEPRDVTFTSAAAAAANQDEEDPPAAAAAAPRPPAKFQGKLPVVRPSRGSTSVEILADWLDLASRRLGLHHRRGLPPCPDAPPPSLRVRALLSSSPCRFPPATTAQLLAARFFDGVNVTYPLLSRARFDADLERALAAGTTPASFAEARGLAPLAQLYLVWAIGFAAEPQQLDDPTGVDPRRYLDYCKTLLGNILLTNTVDNVRAAVLLALCLHCFDDCAGAWNALTLGVNMATSMGLHKPRACRRKCANRKPDALGDEERRAFWLGIYAFEKFLAFEMGHLSSIDDEECYPPRVELASHTGSGASTRERAFAVTIDLARILSEIGRKSVIVSRKEDGVTGAALQAVITEKVQTTGEAQLLLTRWGESVPDELRPTSDILIGSRICPFASFISMHYNTALVILARNSLLISEEAITSGANIIAKGKPWDYIMRNGQSIAANAARKMMRIVLETLDSKSNSIFPSLLAALHALSTLAIHVVTHPESRVSAMDLHLIQTAAQSMKEINGCLRGDGMFNCLLQKVDAIIQQVLPTAPRLADPPAPDTSPSTTVTKPWPHPGDGMNQTEAGWAGQGGGDGRMKDGVPTQNLNVPPFFNQPMPDPDEFGYDPLGVVVPIPGDEWSPSMSDGVGWDWSCFSQLLTDQFQPP